MVHIVRIYVVSADRSVVIDADHRCALLETAGGERMVDLSESTIACPNVTMIVAVGVREIPRNRSPEIDDIPDRTLIRAGAGAGRLECREV